MVWLYSAGTVKIITAADRDCSTGKDRANTIKWSKYTNGMTIYSRLNITIVTKANNHQARFDSN